MNMPVRVTFMLLGIAMILSAGVMRMYYSDKMFTAGLALDSATYETPDMPVQLISYSTNTSDLRLRYSGKLRAQPADLSWDDAVQLRSDITTKINSNSSPALLRELMGVSNALGFAEEYSRAAHLVQLAYGLLVAGIVLILLGIFSSIRARTARGNRPKAA
jgi:uncharacterized membrane protein